MLDGLVRHDRLLTDSLNLGVAHLATSPMTGNGNMTTSENHQIISQISQLPVKTEHSYSMAGSDGDSIPDSPLSLHDTGKKLLGYFNYLKILLDKKNIGTISAKDTWTCRIYYT